MNVRPETKSRFLICAKIRTADSTKNQETELGCRIVVSSNDGTFDFSLEKYSINIFNISNYNINEKDFLNLIAKTILLNAISINKFLNLKTEQITEIASFKQSKLHNVFNNLCNVKTSSSNLSQTDSKHIETTILKTIALLEANKKFLLSNDDKRYALMILSSLRAQEKCLMDTIKQILNQPVIKGV